MGALLSRRNLEVIVSLGNIQHWAGLMLTAMTSESCLRPTIASSAPNLFSPKSWANLLIQIVLPLLICLLSHQVTNHRCHPTVATEDLRTPSPVGSVKELKNRSRTAKLTLN
jgi:hypothetical protein